MITIILTQHVYLLYNCLNGVTTIIVLIYAIYFMWFHFCLYNFIMIIFDTFSFWLILTRDIINDA